MTYQQQKEFELLCRVDCGDIDTSRIVMYGRRPLNCDFNKLIGIQFKMMKYTHRIFTVKGREVIQYFKDNYGDKFKTLVEHYEMFMLGGIHEGIERKLFKLFEIPLYITNDEVLYTLLNYVEF